MESGRISSVSPVSRSKFKPRGVFRDHGERLERHAAFDQVRDVHTPAGAARQQVARSEQAVRVQMRDLDVPLQFSCANRDMVRRLL